MVESVSTIDSVLIALEDDLNVSEEIQAIKTRQARDLYKALWVHIHTNDYVSEEEQIQAFFKRFGYETFQTPKIYFEALLRASESASLWFGRTCKVDGVNVEKACTALNMSPDMVSKMILKASFSELASSTEICEKALAMLDEPNLILFHTNMGSMRNRLREAAVVRWMRSDEASAEKLQQWVTPAQLKEFSLVGRNRVFWKVVGGPAELIETVKEHGLCDLSDEHVKALDLPIVDAVAMAAKKLGIHLGGLQLQWQPTETSWRFS